MERNSERMELFLQEKLLELHGKGDVGWFSDEGGAQTAVVFINWVDKDDGISTGVRISRLDTGGRKKFSAFKLSINRGGENARVTHWSGEGKIEEVIPAIIMSQSVREAIDETRAIFDGGTPIPDAVKAFKSLQERNPFLSGVVPLALDRSKPREGRLFDSLAPLAHIVF